MPPEAAISVILGVKTEGDFILSSLKTDEDGIGVNIISKEHRKL